MRDYVYKINHFGYAAFYPATKLNVEAERVTQQTLANAVWNKLTIFSLCFPLQ